MKNKATILKIFVILLFNLIVGIGLYNILKIPSVQYINKGDYVQDLRDFDFENNNLYFSGKRNWKAYYNQLLTPEEISQGKGDWTIHEENQKDIDYVTYVTNLILDPNTTYGMYLKTFDYAMKIFIDGKEVDSVGVPSDTKEGMTPRVEFKTYFFTPKTGEVDIVVQTSNFVHYEGAESRNFTLGTSENIFTVNKLETGILFIIIGTLLASFFYHLIISIIQRRRTEFLFAMSSIVLLSMIQELIYMFFPNYNWNIVFRLVYIFFYGAFICFPLFMNSLFPNLLNKIINKIFISICIILIILTVFLDTITVSIIMKYFNPLGMAFFVYMTICLGISMKNKKIQNILAFVGMLVLLLFIANDLLWYQNIAYFLDTWSMSFTAPVGMVFFTLCYSIIIAINQKDKDEKFIELSIKEEKMSLEKETVDKLTYLRNKLISNISHETRTPLAVMSGYSELIAKELRDKQINEGIASDLDRISDECLRIAKLMEEMQNITMKKSEKISNTEIDIKNILNNCTRLYEPIFKRKEIDVKVQIEDNLPSIIANADELTQVFFNILENSKNHTENGFINIIAFKEENNIIIKIADTGTGIPKELLPIIFEREVTSSKNGTGFGLTISKEIIESFGGNIYIKNNERLGITVTIVLPIKVGEKHE